MQGKYYRSGIPDEDRRKLIGCFFSGSVVAAPFVALLYGQKASLVVLALALLTVAVFALLEGRASHGVRRKQLLALGLINGGFLILTLMVLALLLD
jgi:hypothetical protein